MVMVILVVLRVTTAYRDAFGKLRASEEKFRSLVETTSDWIWEVDQHGVYTYASPKVRDLLVIPRRGSRRPRPDAV
jgi:PAS domain-containing protein